MKGKKKERTYICSGASDGANDITIIEFRGNAQALLAAVQCSGVAPESSVNLIASRVGNAIVQVLWVSIVLLSYYEEGSSNSFCSLFNNSARRRSAASSRSVIAFSSAFNFSFSSASFKTFDARFCTFCSLKIRVS